MRRWRWRPGCAGASGRPGPQFPCGARGAGAEAGPATGVVERSGAVGDEQPSLSHAVGRHRARIGEAVGERGQLVAGALDAVPVGTDPARATGLGRRGPRERSGGARRRVSAGGPARSAGARVAQAPDWPPEERRRQERGRGAVVATAPTCGRGASGVRRPPGLKPAPARLLPARGADAARFTRLPRFSCMTANDVTPVMVTCQVSLLVTGLHSPCGRSSLLVPRRGDQTCSDAAPTRPGVLEHAGRRPGVGPAGRSGQRSSMARRCWPARPQGPCDRIRARTRAWRARGDPRSARRWPLRRERRGRISSRYGP